MKKSTRKLVFWSLGAVGAVVVTGFVIKKISEAKAKSQSFAPISYVTPKSNVALSGLNTYAVLGNR